MTCLRAGVDKWAPKWPWFTITVFLKIAFFPEWSWWVACWPFCYAVVYAIVCVPFLCWYARRIPAHRCSFCGGALHDGVPRG